MEEFVSSVSPKGQVTIPIAIRNRLGIKPKDKVMFSMDAENVKIKPIKSPLAASFKSVPPLKKPMTLKEMTEAAAEEHAREVAQEGL